MLNALTHARNIFKFEKFSELRFELSLRPEMTFTYTDHYLIRECDFSRTVVRSFRIIGARKYFAAKKIQRAFRKRLLLVSQSCIRIQRAFLQWYYCPDRGSWLKHHFHKTNLCV